MSTLTCLFLPTACNHFCATGYPLQTVDHCILLKPELFFILLILSALRLLRVHLWRILSHFSVLHIMGESLNEIAVSSLRCKLWLQFFLPEGSQTDVDSITFTGYLGGIDSSRPYPW